jgi:hypothetical protein
MPWRGKSREELVHMREEIDTLIENGFGVRVFGIRFHGRGYVAVAALVVVAFMGCIGGMGWLFKNQLDRVGKEHEAIVESLDAIIYVSTLPEAERQRLNLQRPRRILELERGEWRARGQ